MLTKRAWTPEEIEILINLKRQGKDNKEIAQKLNRTIDSVKSKARDLRDLIYRNRTSENKKEFASNSSNVRNPKNNYAQKEKENKITFNVDEAGRLIEMYRNFLWEIVKEKKPDILDNEFTNLLIAIEKYYLRTNLIHGAKELLITLIR